MPKPLAQRMSIRSGSNLRTWPSADQVIPLLVPLPDDVVVASEGRADVVVARCATRADLEAFTSAQLEVLRRADDGVPPVWILFPKGNRSDLNRDSIWRHLVDDHAWRAVSNVSVDATWSALRARPMTTAELAEATGSAPAGRATATGRPTEARWPARSVVTVDAADPAHAAPPASTPGPTRSSASASAATPPAPPSSGLPDDAS